MVFSVCAPHVLRQGPGSAGGVALYGLTRERLKVTGNEELAVGKSATAGIWSHLQILQRLS